MISKAFSSKKEIQEFKKQYSNGEVDSEVISNILQPFHEKKYPGIKRYCDFWWPRDMDKYGLMSTMQLMILMSSKDALESEFGKYDFSFVGNRKYENYILEFENSLFYCTIQEGDYFQR